jgi:anti-sigma B factor antagonist
VQLEITTRDEGGCRVVAPAGELDIATGALLRDALADELAAGHTWVVVDLSGVSFIDSSGIGALVAAHVHFDEAGAGFALASPSERLEKVFQLAGLAETFALADSVAAACVRP